MCSNLTSKSKVSDNVWQEQNTFSTQNKLLFGFFLAQQHVSY